MHDRSKEYHNFFQENYDLFKKVTQYTILLEKIGGGKVEIGAINELRGTLFHLFNYLDDVNEANQEGHLAANAIEAKEHLYRAYYDLFSVICSILKEQIYQFKNDYGITVLSDLYPQYFDQITPGISELDEQISHIRTTRNKRELPIDHLEENHQIIKKLLDWKRSLTSLIPDFVQKKKSGFRKRVAEIAIVACISIGCVFLGYWLNNKNKSINDTNHPAVHSKAEKLNGKSEN